jgi:trk system potassium uptake protein TrkA
MSLNKSYVVFGLGRYGYAVAKELVNNGADVLAIDSSEELVNAVSIDIPFCKCADATDIEVFKQLGIKNFDVAIIAMASNLEASVMAVMLCKEVGVKTVIAKCSNEIHQKVLSKVGADKVVFPEYESGVRLAKNILSSGFIDMVELANNVSLVELDVKKEWIGKSLIELNLRKRNSLNVVAIKINEIVEVNIDPSIPLTEEMKLIVICDKTKLNKLK